MEFLDSRDNKAEFAGQMNLLMRKEVQQLGWGGAVCVRVSVSVGGSRGVGKRK